MRMSVIYRIEKKKIVRNQIKLVAWVKSILKDCEKAI